MSFSSIDGSNESNFPTQSPDSKQTESSTSKAAEHAMETNHHDKSNSPNKESIDGLTNPLNQNDLPSDISNAGTQKTLERALDSSDDSNKLKENVSQEDKNYLIDLILRNDNEAIDLIQNSPSHCQLILQELEQNRDNLPPEGIQILDAINTMTQLTSTNKSLLRTLIYIQKNQHEKLQFESPHKFKFNPLKEKVKVNTRLLGTGSDKKVHAVAEIFKGTIKELAVSVIIIENNIDKLYADNEINLLKKVKENGCPHVIQFVKSKERNIGGVNQIEITTQQYNMGRLDKSLHKLSPEDKKRVASDIIMGIMELHDLGIIHRDLKPSNILLHEVTLENGKKEIHAYIADLGLACERADDTNRNKFCGTTEYMSPKVLDGNNSDFDRDLWSAGLILHAIFKGNVPTLDAENEEEIIEIGNELISEEPNDKNPANSVIWKLLKSANLPNITKEIDGVILNETLELIGSL